MRRLTFLLALATLGLSACGDSGPKGPGSFTATLEQPSTPIGAAIVTVTGEGVRGISATGSTRMFTRASDDGGSHRVVLVNTASGPLVFKVEVADVSGAQPMVTIAELVDMENRPMVAPPGLRVRLEL